MGSAKRTDRQSVAQGKSVEFRRALFRSGKRLSGGANASTLAGKNFPPRRFDRANLSGRQWVLRRGQIGRASRKERAWSSDVRSSDLEKGYRVERTHPHWLAKIFRRDDLIDLIYRAGNGLCEVD